MLYSKISTYSTGLGSGRRRENSGNTHCFAYIKSKCVPCTAVCAETAFALPDIISAR